MANQPTKKVRRRQGPKTLSPLQLRAIEEYLSDPKLEKKAAMIRAGYSVGMASTRANTVFNNPLVQAEIARRLAPIKKRYEITKDAVLQEMAILAFSNPGAVHLKLKQNNYDLACLTEDELKIVNELTEKFTVTSEGVVSKADEDFDEDGNPLTEYKAVRFGTLDRKVKLNGDKKAALDSLMRYLGLFEDKLNITVQGSLEQRLMDGRARAFIRNKDRAIPLPPIIDQK